MKKKTVALLMACMMALGVAVGGTMAWLTSGTAPVVNTFTVGDINIDLKEHDYLPATNTLDEEVEVATQDDYNFVPGATLKKDPFVKVKQGSEDCYLFLKVVANNKKVLVTNPDGTAVKDAEGNDTYEDALQYAIDTGWTPVPDHPGYWYREVKDIPESITTPYSEYLTFDILAGNTVEVSPYITKGMVGELGNGGSNKLSLSFQAAAVQFDNIEAADGKTALEVAFELAPWPTTPANP